MFAKHLPPSASLPRVLVLDEASRRELPIEIEVVTNGDEADAVVGCVRPENLEQWWTQLRPGGRLILAHAAPAEELLAALTSAGFIHCLVEPFENGLTLYRGEKPRAGSPLSTGAHIKVASVPEERASATPFIFLLITQTPNKPVWKLAPDEKLEWRAACGRDPLTEQISLLAFSSLVKAVAFMQKAVLAQWLAGINKVGQFRAEVAPTWDAPLTLNPEFETVRGWATAPPLSVDPQVAITGEE